MVRARATEKVTKRHRPVSSVSRRTRIRIPTHIPRAIIAIQKSTGGRSSPATTGHLSYLCRQAEVRQHQWRAVDSCLEIVHQGQHQSGNPHQYSGKPQSTQQRPQGEHHSAVKDAGQQQIGGPFHEPLPHDGEGTGNHPLDGHRHSQPHAKAAAQKHDPAQPTPAPTPGAASVSSTLLPHFPGYKKGPRGFPAAPIISDQYASFSAR